MAEVFRARAPGAPATDVAVKRLLPELAHRSDLALLLRKEGELTGLLHHPNIVPLIEIVTLPDSPAPLLVLELVHGVDLLQVLARCTTERVRFPLELALHIVAEVARALAFAHALRRPDGTPLNVVHRDVSPSNVMLTHAGAVQLTDFGVALTADDPCTPTDLGAFKGKLGYMSPEQVTGRPLDHRSDIFSLGILLFEILTLKRLFVGQTDLQTILNIRNADVDRRFKRHGYIPLPVRALLRTALAPNPEDRFQTATDFQEAILDYLFEAHLAADSQTLATFLSQVPTIPAIPAAVPAIPTAIPAIPPAIPAIPTAVPAVPAPPRPVPPTLPPSSASSPRILRRLDLSHASFLLRTADAPPFGPITLSQLSALLAARAIAPDELVSLQNSDWLCVADLPALVDLHPVLFAAPSAPPLSDGPLNPVTFLSILLRIHRQRLTGNLHLRRHTTSTHLYFDAGALSLAQSNDKATLLGAHLVRTGQLAPATLQASLTSALAASAPLGQILIAQGDLTPSALATALRHQAASRLRIPFTWPDGWFELFEGTLPPAPTLIPPIPLPPLALDALRAPQLTARLAALFTPYLDRPALLSSQAPPALADMGATAEEHLALTALTAAPTLRIFDPPPLEGPLAAIPRVALLLHRMDLLNFRANA